MTTHGPKILNNTCMYQSTLCKSFLIGDRMIIGNLEAHVLCSIIQVMSNPICLRESPPTNLFISATAVFAPFASKVRNQRPTYYTNVVSPFACGMIFSSGLACITSIPLLGRRGSRCGNGGPEMFIFVANPPTRLLR